MQALTNEEDKHNMQGREIRYYKIKEMMRMKDKYRKNPKMTSKHAEILDFNKYEKFSTILRKAASKLSGHLSDYNLMALKKYFMDYLLVNRYVKSRAEAAVYADAWMRENLHILKKNPGAAWHEKEAEYYRKASDRQTALLKLHPGHKLYKDLENDYDIKRTVHLVSSKKSKELHL